MNATKLFPRCPYLGINGDRNIYCLFPDAVHRCYRDGTPKQINSQQQVQFCLSECHTDCPALLGQEKEAGHTRAPHAAQRLLRGLNDRMHLPYTAAAGIAAALIFLFLADGADLSRRASPSGNPNVGSPSDTATVESRGTPSATAIRVLPAATNPPDTPRFATAIPTVIGTAVLTATATVAPPTPYGQRIHIVAAGENLTGIAIRYGTTVEALIRANGIDSKNLIFTGQRLIIP